MSDTLSYKGYSGSVDFSAEDNCLYGKILGIKDLISYEGKTIEEIKADFVSSVDDYLQTCESIGKAPQKAYKGSFNVRISPELHKKAAEEAAKNNRSLNWVVGKAIEKYFSVRQS